MNMLLEVAICALITMFFVKLLYQMHNVNFWGSTRIRILIVAVFLPLFVVIGNAAELFQQSEEYACLNTASDEDMQYQNAMMEEYLQEQSDLAVRARVLWIGFAALLFGSFVFIQIQIARIYELARRRQIVAAFLGEVYSVVNEGLTHNQFTQLLRNQQIQHFQANEGDNESIMESDVCTICMEPQHYDASI